MLHCLLHVWLIFCWECFIPRWLVSFLRPWTMGFCHLPLLGISSSHPLSRLSIYGPSFSQAPLLSLPHGQGSEVHTLQASPPSLRCPPCCLLGKDGNVLPQLSPTPRLSASLLTPQIVQTTKIKPKRMNMNFSLDLGISLKLQTPFLSPGLFKGTLPQVLRLVDF